MRATMVRPISAVSGQTRPAVTNRRRAEAGSHIGAGFHDHTHHGRSPRP